MVVPTYNERTTLPLVVSRLHDALPSAHVLVVDDNSPDGTGELADDLAAADPRVHVLHRERKAGLGRAYVAGFDWALRGDYAVIVEMDADGSHAPEELPHLLAALSDADLALGSRYVPGGRVVGWPKRREVLSRAGNLYSMIALGVRVKDITGGYRAYRRAVLEKVEIGEVSSQGYCFQIDLAWRTMTAGFTIAEVPITFTDRQAGTSKMGGSVVVEALLRVTAWGLRHRRGQLFSAVRRWFGPRRGRVDAGQ